MIYDSKNTNIKVILAARNTTIEDKIKESIFGILNLEITLDVVNDLVSLWKKIKETSYTIIIYDILTPSYKNTPSAGPVKLNSADFDIPIICITPPEFEAIAVDLSTSYIEDYIILEDISQAILVKSFKLAFERNSNKKILTSTALIDHETGIFNRKLLLIIAEQQIERSNRTKSGMLMINIELPSKSIEKNIIYTLKDCLRKSDIIGRLDNDTIIALLTDASNGNHVEIINRVRKEIQNAVSTSGEKIKMGMAVYDPEFPCNLLELAQMASAYAT